MRKKSICFFVGTDRHHDEVLIFKQAKTLQENGFDVSYVVSDDEDYEIKNGIPIKGIDYKSKGYFNRTFITPFFLYRKLKKIDADVYQTCSIDQLMVCLLLKMKGKKIIFHLREGHPYTYYRKSSKPLFIKKIVVHILSIWMKFALRRFDAVITVTHEIANYLKSWNIKQLHVHGNFPVISDHFNFSLEEYKMRNNIILYFGTIYKISYQEIFFDAITNIKDVKYRIAGKFRNDDYEKCLREHAYWNKIDFINGFDIEQLPYLLKQATISNVIRDFSKSECSNGSLGIIKIFESMEAGLPIICTDVPVYREIMKEYKCGILVDPNNKKQIGDAIQYLIDHKEEAYHMGQEGRRAVIEKYSWNALSKEYLKIIDNAVTIQ